MSRTGLLIKEVTEDSIASQLGVSPGDRIIKINGYPVKDILDYWFLEADEEIKVRLVKADGEEWLLDIEKDLTQDLGLSFDVTGFDPIFGCQNKCIFCFIDQLPPNMRESLYVKDDDYRLSFARGNFITLTNLSSAAMKRIVQRRLSPLYVSVHTTNPVLRKKMLNHPRAGNIMEQLAILAKGNITLHTQVVLCPGINDKEELKRTIQDLGRLWPVVCSLAIVPVGLTRYRQGLYPLRCVNSREAEEVIREVEKQQAYYLKRYGYPFVYASDEFYFLAGLPVPAEKYYADYPQTENGVGLTRLFLNEGAKAAQKIPEKLDSPRQVTIVTGVLGRQVLNSLVNRLNQVENLKINLAVIPNHFFGEQISVAGLLTTDDICRSLTGKLKGELVIIPATALLEKSTVFLDEVTITEMEERLGVSVKVAKGARELVQICCRKDFKWISR
ncbi:hypothetical protein HY02_08365 [Peptococcaceae bacterium SCADC1_2_3]|nr:hypothetical protein DK28_0214410 [Peptococcaceae bacterium SCADC1_2_3]KFI38103.1 hypothetical protein HY02_08365 [Peptococcaceae bacterium SCADC1_2_3]